VTRGVSFPLAPIIGDVALRSVRAQFADCDRYEQMVLAKLWQSTRVHGGHSTHMDDSRKERVAEIQESIRRILRHDWNPIGFGDVLPEDEYDSYIAPVYRILTGRITS
jgi:hypothetical protein